MLPEAPADASTLIYLGKASAFPLAMSCVRGLLTPPAVWDEAVVAGQAGGHEEVRAIVEAEESGFVRRTELDRRLRRTSSQIRSHYGLGMGESEVIAAAQPSGLAILDEGRASRVAESLGLRVVSTLFLPVLALGEGVAASEAKAVLRRLAEVTGARADLLILIEQEIEEIK